MKDLKQGWEGSYGLMNILRRFLDSVEYELRERGGIGRAVRSWSRHGMMVGWTRVVALDKEKNGHLADIPSGHSQKFCWVA